MKFLFPHYFFRRRAAGLAVAMLVLMVLAAGNNALAALPPARLIDSVAKVQINRDPELRDRFGSGFFVDLTGCLLTMAHVAIDLRVEPPKPFEKIEIEVTRDFGKPPELVGPAQVKFFDPEVDIAVVCLDGIDFYPELALASDQEINQLGIGDPVTVLGYPAAGGDTVTFAFGHVIGFWNEPDVSQILGAENVKPQRINLIKHDAVAGSGSSGSPILNQNDKVLGIMFAGQIFSPIPGFAIWSKSFFNWEEKMISALPGRAGCIFDPLFNLYAKDTKHFYDPQCQIERDKNIEFVVKANWEARCPSAIPPAKLRKAAGHIKKGSTIDKWFDYLKKVCPLPDDLNEESSVKSEQSTPSGADQTAPADIIDNLKKSEELTIPRRVWYFK